MAQVWTIFLMLMQKDWILSLRNCNQLVFKILFPICVCGVLLALRLTTPKEFVLQPYIYEPLPISNKSAYRLLPPFCFLRKENFKFVLISDLKN